MALSRATQAGARCAGAPTQPGACTQAGTRVGTHSQCTPTGTGPPLLEVLGVTAKERGAMVGVGQKWVQPTGASRFDCVGKVRLPVLLPSQAQGKSQPQAPSLGQQSASGGR